MNDKIKLVLVAAILLIAGGVIYFSYFNEKEPQIEQVTATSSYVYGRELSEVEVVDETGEILDILDTLYYVTQETTSSIEPDTTSALIMQMMTESLTDKSTVNGLMPRAERLADSDNEVVSTVGMGLFAGLNGLSVAEENFVQFLRTVDPTNPDFAEFQYQMSVFNSAQKEAFKLISISAGQLSLLFWNAAETENSTGPIPYRISTDARQKILAKIDYLFADDIVADERNHTLTGSTNAVIFIVNSYRDSLMPDTYEEAAAE